MYNNKAITDLCEFISSKNGIGNKDALIREVQTHFGLTQDGKVYYNTDFAIRFGWNGKNNSKNISNTILALSKIKTYDSLPLLFCIVTHQENHLLLMNTTFLKKVSHSSQALRVNNIKGSINCGDIIQTFHNLTNSPSNFEELFGIHSEFTFQDNLERLVNLTNGIVGTVKKFVINEDNQETVFESIDRAKRFVVSEEYTLLKKDLDSRVQRVQGEIAIAAAYVNVNIRGRLIEYLITHDESELTKCIVKAMYEGTPIPTFVTENKLEDYSYVFRDYNTKTDIKTKILFLKSNPKAYNIDKLLEFLSQDNSVYMIYLVGIDEDKSITVRLCSMFDNNLIKGTRIQPHWAGRNSRGVAQFEGVVLEEIIRNDKFSSKIEDEKATNFLTKLINGSGE